MTRVLVLGGLGFIGSAIVRELMQTTDCKIWTLDNVSTYHNTLDEALLWKAVYLRSQGFKTDNIHKNITDNLDSDFETIKPHVVINLVAYPSVKLVDLYPRDSLVNMCLGQFNVLNLCKKHGVEKFIYFSSSMVYGNWTQDVMTEDLVARPINLYGQYKLFCETLSEHFNVQTYNIRPCAVYGPGDYSARVLNQFCLNALKDQPLIVNDPDTNIDFTYVSDLAQATRLIVTRDSNSDKFHSSVNVSGGRSISLAQVVDVLESIANKKLTVIRNNREHNQPQRGQLGLDYAKSLGYEPKVSFEQGLEKLYAYTHQFYQH